MYLSMNWLADFVDIDATPKEFLEDLTMTGSKVEKIEIMSDKLKNVVVGKILSIENHPDADKLVVCMVDIGKSEAVQIVTGADNLSVGDLVAAALHKSVLPNGLKIKRGKLRGVASNGMLCSLDELELSADDFPYADEEGILVLKEDVKPGDDAAKILGFDDLIVEFEITPNRGDCLSIIGLAREVAATYDKPLKKLLPKVKKPKNYPDKLLKDVKVKSELCDFYSARVIRDIKIAPSPRWMRERLRSAGIRPINNIVDITNYVMLTFGVPMHAFDTTNVSGGNIIVRTAEDGEGITLLDGSSHALNSSNLVIADEEKIIGVAGVMGGKYSGVSDDTESVIFESAHFEPISVRLTAKDVKERTESSLRFEKNIDANLCIPALTYACQLVEELGAGVVDEDQIIVDNRKDQSTVIALDHEWINGILGIDIPKDEMIKILEKLEFEYKDGDITAPSFRKDIENKADIAEEVARFYGYDKIPSTVMKGIATAKLTQYQIFEETVLTAMTSVGSYEIKTYSFIDPAIYEKLLIPKDSDLYDFLRISNPLGAETSVMRTITIPSMMNILAKNANYRNAGVNFFEIGTEYIKVDGQELPDENDKLTIGLFGELDPDKFTFGTPEPDINDEYNFFHLKGMVEALFKTLHITDYSFASNENYIYMHPGRTADVLVGGKIIGHIGETHPNANKNFGLKTKVLIGYLDMKLLYENSVFNYDYAPLPKYPSVGRDLALVADKNVKAMDIVKVFEEVSGNLLEKSYIFNVFEGGNLPKDKKSIAFSLVFRSKEATLTDEQVEEKIQAILARLEKMNIFIR